MSFKTAKVVSYIFFILAVALLVYTGDNGFRFPFWVWLTPMIIGVLIWLCYGKCPYCGAQLKSSLFVQTCPSCGKPLNVPIEEVKAQEEANKKASANIRKGKKAKKNRQRKKR